LNEGKYQLGDIITAALGKARKNSCQLSAVSYQLSAISYQLSAISYQLSAISYQPFDQKWKSPHFK
jgi:hypothetical protein